MGGSAILDQVFLLQNSCWLEDEGLSAARQGLVCWMAGGWGEAWSMDFLWWEWFCGHWWCIIVGGEGNIREVLFIVWEVLQGWLSHPEPDGHFLKKMLTLVISFAVSLRNSLVLRPYFTVYPSSRPNTDKICSPPPSQHNGCSMDQWISPNLSSYVEGNAVDTFKKHLNDFLTTSQDWADPPGQTV